MSESVTIRLLFFRMLEIWIKKNRQTYVKRLELQWKIHEHLVVRIQLSDVHASKLNVIIDAILKVFLILNKIPEIK